MKSSRVSGLSVLLIFMATVSVQSWAYDVCGSLANAYGPYDFWTDKDKLPIVEGAHFTSSVETLKAGLSGSVSKELDYTLRAFPNHPRALMAMVRLGEKERTDRPRGARYSVSCYLQRAVRFRPEDGMARMIYGTYLAKHKQSSQALEQLEKARELAGENPNLLYNLGLAYVDLKDYDKALASAHKAYRLGFQLPGLRNKLVQAGKWSDPPPEPVAEEKPDEAQKKPE